MATCSATTMSPTSPTRRWSSRSAGSPTLRPRPGELIWVPEDADWGALNGSLLNLSYGMGRIFLVPHEKLPDGRMQGGMISLGMDFPTGTMRGRFHPKDGQLYTSGMFAWAGNKRQDGGLYRIRATGKEANLPTGLRAVKDGIILSFTDPLDGRLQAAPVTTV